MQDPIQPRQPWADAELSILLPQLCAQGEGQSLEFKSELPEQLHGIVKTMASFASSNDGRLIIGVGDDGSIIGLAEADHAQTRDHITRRILGIAKEVKPPVHPSVAWAVHAGKVVCVVSIEKGFEAIYYAAQRPIIRRGASSRPAEPSEVEEAFRRRYANTTSAAPLPTTTEISQRLGQVLQLMNVDRYEPLSVVDLARAIDLASPAELDAVFEGRQAPTFAMLDQACARFALDKEWLATGRGEPFSSPIEHQAGLNGYLGVLEEEAIECLYLVRSKSDVGESFFVAQTDALKFWRLPDVWHVSDHVGGGGASDLKRLFELFRKWIDTLPGYMLLGRIVDPELAKEIIDGRVYPGIVEGLPLSHWWDDLTDLDHKWTSRESSRKAYGKGFVAAQDMLRRMLAGESPWPTPLPY